MRRVTISILALALITIAFTSSAFAGMGGGNILPAGAAAPDFKFTDLDGNSGSLYEFKKGEPLLLVFIQRTCRSCQREMEFLKEAKVRNRELNILGVFIDAVDKNLKGYKQEIGLPFNFLWDPDLEVADQYGVTFAPTSFLLDKNRVISKVFRGWSRQEDELENDFKLLNSK